MLERRYWPFELADTYEPSEEDNRDFAFLEQAHRAGHRAYITEGLALGAAANDGRDGDIVRRGGRGRYWEIVLSENNQVIGRQFIDGFEPAALAVLSWLQGEPYHTICEQIAGSIVSKPGERGWH